VGAGAVAAYCIAPRGKRRSIATSPIEGNVDMVKKKFAAFTFALALSAACGATFAQTLDRSSCLEAERMIYLARAAEKRGDVAGAAQNYMTAISYLTSSAPRDVNLGKVILCDEPVSSIGRRMVYYQIKLLRDEVGKPDSLIRQEDLLNNDPTWKYLDAVASAADSDYRAAFQKCREAATTAGGDEAIRKKARSLAQHIKPGALEQEKMAYEDRAAYREYVESGAQALDFAMTSARCSADEATKRGDTAAASMWESRYEDLSRRRTQIKIK
jgi:hypothetical protein